MAGELDTILKAPDGTYQTGAHILVSKDAGVNGMVFECAVTFCDGFSCKLMALVSGQILSVSGAKVALLDMALDGRSWFVSLVECANPLDFLAQWKHHWPLCLTYPTQNGFLIQMHCSAWSFNLKSLSILLLNLHQ